MVRETVAEHNGKTRAISKVGQGTTFFIDLPCVTRVTENTQFTLHLDPTQTVLIVDDEPSLREQWRLILKKHGINTLLCRSYEDIIQQNIGASLISAAIIDYHFGNSEKTGIDIVKYLQSIGCKNLYLCTAEYWKPQLQREIRELNVPICPKPIPKVVINAPYRDRSKGYSILLIDDDPSIRMSWDMMRQKLKIAHLHSYSNLEELQSSSINLAAIDIAFVDKNIEGSRFSGAEVVQYLKNHGLNHIILASGEAREDLEKDPLFHAVTGVLTEKIPKDLSVFLTRAEAVPP